MTQYFIDTWYFIALANRFDGHYAAAWRLEMSFLRGLDRYALRPDKEYSHVDCMSMVLMEELGIRSVFTNDHHFTQAGFRVISDAP